MSVSFILGLIGISVSLLFGAWGVYLAIKHRYPGRVDFLNEQAIGLFDAIVKNLSDLAVTYRGSPVSPRLVLLKGALINTGSIDVSPSMVDLPLTLGLPKDFKWLAGRIISTSERVSASLDIPTERELRITSGLFRCKEHIRFQALAEVPEMESRDPTADHRDLGTALLDAIEFNHRIANTRKIRKLDLENPIRLRRRMRFSLIALGASLGVSVFLGGVLLWRGMPSELTYHFKPDEATSYHVRVTPRRDGTVRVVGIDNDYSATMTLDEFLSKSQGKPSISVAKEVRLIVLLFLGAYVGLPSLFALVRYRQYRRNKKLAAALGLEEPGPEPRLPEGAT